MYTILLMGNPNVGKSVVFSRLTGANVIASNYPGTTVDISEGRMNIAGISAHVIDAPGTYSLQPTNKAEEVSVRLLDDADVIVNVVDATNLERNLFLLLQLLERNIPMVVALNMWDETEHLGIDIDLIKLEELLGITVVPTVALTGEGIKTLVDYLPDAQQGVLTPMTDEERWVRVGTIVQEVLRITHRHHTLKDKLQEATIKPATGLPIAVGILLLTFLFVRVVGEGLIALVVNPVFEVYLPVVSEISESLPSGLLHDILIGDLVDGKIDYLQSMGLLTTALYVPFGAVLPYIIAFYTALSILEDTGYLPRLATLVDTIFHRLGMHGYGIVPVFLGMGCNVSGMLATRGLETRKQRFIAATLLAISVPCMAQTAMIFGVLGSYGIRYVLIVFGVLVLTFIVMGILLNRLVSGISPEIFLDIPPYRQPSLPALAKKTWMRIRWFLKDAIPWLFFGVLVVNLFYAVGFMQWMGDVFSPITEGLLGLPHDATTALLIGFLRKDLAVGMLIPLNMHPLQLVIAATLLTVYFPCVATFVIMFKELGVRDTLKSVAIMVTVALLIGGIMRIGLLGL